MYWTTIKFGEHKGKTLPELLMSDPDYFFWIVEEEVFYEGCRLDKEAKELDRKARAIKIPQAYGEEMEAEYRFHKGSFVSLKIVPKSTFEYGSSETIRREVIDMSIPRLYKNYDKPGNQLYLKTIKRLLFGNGVRVTKRMCEEFFADDGNFLL